MQAHIVGNPSTVRDVTAPCQAGTINLAYTVMFAALCRVVLPTVVYHIHGSTQVDVGIKSSAVLGLRSDELSP
jgi:hypothetical protein